MSVQKFAKTAVVSLSVLALGACNASLPSINWTQAQTDIITVAKKIDQGVQLAQQDLGPACAAVSEVVSLANLMVADGIVANSSAVNQTISIGNAIATNPLCTTALNGGAVSNPAVLSSDIIDFVASIIKVTSGKVNASTAVTSNNPAVVAALKKALHRTNAKKHH